MFLLYLINCEKRKERTSSLYRGNMCADSKELASPKTLDMSLIFLLILELKLLHGTVFVMKRKRGKKEKNKQKVWCGCLTRHSIIVWLGLKRGNEIDPRPVYIGS